MVMGEEESINCEEAFDSIFSHFIQEFVIDSVLGEYRFAFDETEENMSDEVRKQEVIIPDSVGDWLHPTIKCTDLSKSTDKLFDVRRLHESFDLDLEDEEEELISNIILDRLIEGTQEAITFQITESNEQDTDVTQEADTVQSVENNEQGNSFLDMVTDGTQERVTFQVNESNEQGNKFIDRERAKSHHFGVGRTSSIRNVYNTIFHRSKSSTKRVKEPEELENLVSNKKNRRFFKRTRRKKQEPTPTSIEVQEGTDVSSQVQSKLISRLFTGQKANRGQENDNEKMLDGTGHSRTVLGGIRNSLMNLFRNRVVV